MELKIYSKSAKKVFDITSLVDGEAVWTTERDMIGKLEFNLIKEGGISFLEGDMVTFRMDPHPLVPEANSVCDAFKGYVFKKVKSEERIKVTCFDQMFYLNQCIQTYNFKEKTVKEVIEIIAKEYGLQVGVLKDPMHVLPTHLYNNQSLFTTIMSCVEKTNVATGKVYAFYDNFGELTLKEASDMKCRVVIGNSSLATGYEYTTSLEDSYNYIKLAKGENTVAVVRDGKSIDEWGMLQYFEEPKDGLNEAQLQERAKMLFQYYGQKRRKLSLKAEGVPDIRAGGMVLVDIEGLGDIDLTKILLVNKCVHRLSAQGHTMDLEMEVYNG